LNRLTTYDLFKAHGLESQDTVSADPLPFEVRNRSGKRRRSEQFLTACRNTVKRDMPPEMPVVPHIPHHERITDNTQDAQTEIDADTAITSPSPVSHADMQASSFFMRRARIDTMRSRMELSFVKNITAPDQSAQDGHRVPYHTQRFGNLCRAPQILLCCFGIVQWREGRCAIWYCRAASVMPAFLAGLSVFSALQRGQSGIEAVFDGFHAFGCFIAMVSLQQRRIYNLVGTNKGLLDQFANKKGFSTEWHWMSFRRCLVVLLGGMTMLTSKIWLILDPACSGNATGELGHFLFFSDLFCSVLITGFIVVLMYCQLHVSSCLHVAVDVCTLRLFREKDIANAMSRWNVLQATLRQAASTIEGAFCGLGLSLVMVFVFACLQFMQRWKMARVDDASCVGLWYGWMVPPWALMMYVFFRATDITELCSRVPPLINTSTFSTVKLKYDAQQAVRYIVHSEVGYYINGVRVTSHMGMKVAYLLCVVIATVVTQTLLK